MTKGGVLGLVLGNVYVWVKDFSCALPSIGRQKNAVTATGYDCFVFIRKLPFNYVEGLGTLDISESVSVSE